MNKGGLRMETILVSTARKSEVVHPVRTEAQRETVRKITGSSEFDFALGNPFTKEVSDFTGTFSFLYVTKDGKLHLARISPTGRITKSCEA